VDGIPTTNGTETTKHDDSRRAGRAIYAVVQQLIPHDTNLQTNMNARQLKRSWEANLWHILARRPGQPCARVNSSHSQDGTVTNTDQRPPPRRDNKTRLVALLPCTRVGGYPSVLRPHRVPAPSRPHASLSPSALHCIACCSGTQHARPRPAAV
jgi:hypothetical protein